MSTRALYTFIDPEREQDTFHVYKHHDGYPKGAAQHIEAALAYAWPLPRFEADEFAAAFAAANKSHYRDRELELLRQLEKLGEQVATEENGREIVALRKSLADIRYYIEKGIGTGGGVRLMHTGSVYAVAPGNIEYRYEITLVKGKLQVTAYKTDFWDVRIKANEKRIYKGGLEGLAMCKLEEPGGCGAARNHVLQAITTRYLGPTDHKGSRIKAKSACGSLTVHYDGALNTEDNHREAAEALIAKLDWAKLGGVWHQGGLPDDDGYCFVCVPD